MQQNAWKQIGKGVNGHKKNAEEASDRVKKAVDITKRDAIEA